MNSNPRIHFGESDDMIGLNLDRLLYWQDNGERLSLYFVLATTEGEPDRGPCFFGKDRRQLLAYLKARSLDITPVAAKELR